MSIKQKMALKIILLLFLICIPIISIHSAQATLTFDQGNVLKTTTDLGNQDPADITYSIINWSLTFLGLITVIMIIVAGFMWIFAAGSEEKITKAKNLLKGAIIGLLIVLASYGIASYVFTAFVDITQGDTATPAATESEVPTAADTPGT